MDTVSCRAFVAVRKMARLAGVPMSELLTGLDAAKHWESEEARVAWDEWVTVFERLGARVPGDGALGELASRAMLDAEGHALGEQLKSACPDTRALFELLVKYAFPATYGPARFALEVGADGALTCSVEILGGFAGSRPWLVVFEGAMTPLPVMTGLGPVEFERLELSERRAAWRITPPEVQKRRTPVPSSRAIVDELVRQQALLTDALEALHMSEREYRAALDALPMMVALHDGGQVRFVNSAFAEAFAQTPESLVGRTLVELFPPETRAPVEAVIADPSADWVRVDRGGTSVGAQVIWGRGGGATSFGGKTNHLFLGADSTREAAILKRAERSESTAKALLGALPDLVLRFDAGLVLRALYGGAGFGERPRLDGLIGKTLVEVQRGLDMEDGALAQQVRDHAQRALESGEARAHTVKWTFRTGEAREFLLRYVPSGAGLLLISSDRSALLDETRRLDAAERMASSGELAAGVAAEVEAPVSAVIDRLHDLRAELEDGSPRDPVLEELLEELVEGSVRIRDTAARLRAYSTVQPSARQLVRLSEVVERAVRMTHNELRYRAALRVEVPPELATWGDPRELEQVFVTLLTNAAQALPAASSPETHHVWIAGSSEGARAVVSVMDDGSFVAPSDLPHLFEPFTGSRGPASLGPGLGLARCQRVVAAHGGTIDAHSEPGRTRVLVKLPQARG
jgi:signal transduction histidine kinase